MRHARPSRTAKGVEGDRVVTLVRIVGSVARGCLNKRWINLLS